MKTLAYLRVSKDSQDVTHQRLAVLEFTRHDTREIDDFMELRVSSRRSPKERQLDVLLTRLEPGDTLIVSELSRMGRSVGEIMTIVDTLVKQHIQVVAIQEGIRLEGRQDLQTKVMVTLFGLFAESERELISRRTKKALAAARAAGKRLGSPPGRRGHSKLDGKEADIRRLWGLRVSKASIAKITGVDRSTLYHFMRSRHVSQDDVGHRNSRHDFRSTGGE
jgi:DNA invertase Pin-like site-specific DNA recombinase